MNAIMLPTLVYRCGVRSLSKQQEPRVQATQVRVLRRIEGVSRRDRVKNENIKLRLGQEHALDVVRRRLEKWKNRLGEMN